MQLLLSTTISRGQKNVPGLTVEMPSAGHEAGSPEGAPDLCVFLQRHSAPSCP